MTLHIADDNQGFDKLPPHSIEAEMCLLASMMIDRNAAIECLRTIESESFYLTDHKIIFEAIRGLLVESRPVDAVILRSVLKDSGELDRIGGSAYIGEILRSVPSAGHIDEYARTVREKSMLRSLIGLSDNVTRRAFSGQIDPQAIVEELQSELTKLATSSHREQVMTLEDLGREALTRLKTPNAAEFVTYGFETIDNRLMGIDRGEFIVVGARASMGKSTLLRQMAINGACDGHPTLFVSLEENPSKVGRNVLAWWSRTENQRIRRGDVRPHELTIIEDAAAKMRGIPFYFVWGTNRADTLRSLIMSYVTRFKIKTVFLDYLQLVDAGGKTDLEKATNASRFCASIPKTIDVRMVAAAQLNRAVAAREDHRPAMTDLRSTGQIEQDADVILLLHREDYYHTNDANYANTNEAEVIIAKARDSERGESLALRSCLAYQCFEDIARTDGEQMNLPEGI